MKFYIILISLCILASCGRSGESSDLENCIFHPIEIKTDSIRSTRVFTLSEVWTRTPELDSSRCEQATFFLSDYLQLDDICIPVTIDWPCDLPPECELLRYRDAVEICINQRDEILWAGTVIDISAIDTLFMLYYLNNGEHPSRPASPYRTRFYLEWSTDANQSFVEEVLLRLTEEYAQIISSEIGEVEDLCRFYKKKGKEIRSKYPFNLKLVYDEWDYDRIPPVPQPPPEHINSVEDEKY